MKPIATDSRIELKASKKKHKNQNPIEHPWIGDEGKNQRNVPFAWSSDGE